jgi:hypothetical protein
MLLAAGAPVRSWGLTAVEFWTLAQRAFTEAHPAGGVEAGRAPTAQDSGAAMATSTVVCA